ncbi:MAG: hypothetical protein KDI76_14210 [Xanthomonadales bacterium]|nr:hypothetical protein [Xanthomonadales bacterium]
MNKIEKIRYKGMTVNLVSYDFLPEKTIAVSTDIYEKIKNEHNHKNKPENK